MRRPGWPLAGVTSMPQRIHPATGGRDRVAPPPLHAPGPSMRRTLHTMVVVALYVLAFAVPVAASLWASHRVAVQDQTFRTSVIAGEMLHRAHTVSEQIARIRASLLARHDGPPCSPASIAAMRNLAIGASYLQLVGYVEGDRLMCSSYGDHGEGIWIGPPDYRNNRGAAVRREVSLPFDTQQRFFAVTEPGTGYTSMALPDLIVDAGRDEPGIPIALVSITNRALFMQRGQISLSDIPPLVRGDGTRTWQNKGEIGVVRYSDTYDYAAVSVSPARVVYENWYRKALWLVPFGTLLGIALMALLRDWLRKRQALPAMLDRALRRGELSLVYMPIVELASGRWIGAEALLRWQLPGGQCVPPDRFIPVAEQYGRIRDVTARVLELFVADARALPLDLARTLYFSINLSAQDLAAPSIVADLRAARDAAGVHGMMVEATEGVLLHADQVRANLMLLREQGIRVAIDDFGTGYANLSYLGSLEVDTLKIDKSFISAIGTASVRSHVMPHIAGMAREAGLAVIAEGVETPEQAKVLFARGVQFAQGWLYGKPMPIGELIRAYPGRAAPAKASAAAEARAQAKLPA